MNIASHDVAPLYSTKKNYKVMLGEYYLSSLTLWVLGLG